MRHWKRRLRDTGEERLAIALRLHELSCNVAREGIRHQHPNAGLVWNKMTPSDRQLGDAAGVVAVQSGKLDTMYLKEWSESLGVKEELNKFLSGQIRPKRT
jgi:hypothetical protein